jgi:uncharacterized membrane protein YphA (DoxX/SURF4 family)
MTTRAHGAGVVGSTAALSALSSTASAHVDYVVDSPEEVADALGFVLETLANPLNAALLGGGGAALVIGVIGYLRYRPLALDVAAFRASMTDYADLVPWLVRIAVGFPLVGAGFSGYFFSPVVEVRARLLFVGLGFLLLFGLATRVVAMVGLVTYAVGLAIDPAVLLASEFVAGFLAIVALGPGRPSADQVLAEIARAEGSLYGRLDPIHELAQKATPLLPPLEGYAPTILRVGLGLNFVYLGLVQKLLEPGSAMAVVAKYDLTAVVPVAPELWVVGAGLTEIAVGLALVAGAFTRASAVTALVLFTTTLFGLPDDPVLAHLSLFGLVSAVLITGGGPLSVDGRIHADEIPDDGRRKTTGATGD